MLQEKGCKPLKASQKIPKLRCTGLERSDRLSNLKYFFVEYKDGKGFQEQDHDSRMCILKDRKGQCWHRSRRDLQFYLSAN
jgi:hypothetical protein